MMNNHYLTEEIIAAYERWLCQEERSVATQEKYLRNVRSFRKWLEGHPVSKESVTAWKASLEKCYAPSTVNTMLAALNRLFAFTGWVECSAKYLKIQRRLFRDAGQDLDRQDYKRLVIAARRLGRERIALVMETICATGIRVSEVRYITVEAARQGCATIALKGKIRTILLPEKLCQKLLKYAMKEKIASGEIFLTRGGKPMGRCQIWAEMKQLCKKAGVETSKVFPHNLRHLFAIAYYQIYKDIVKLADILGHSSVETTRIYLLTTGQEHRRQLERLQLVL